MSEWEGIDKADVCICAFPHLPEFLVMRASPHSDARLFRADEVLTEDFFREVEKEFSEALRDLEAPFLNLMSLPHRVEVLLQEKSLAFILGRLRSTGGEPVKVAILLGSGPVLSLPEGDLARAVREFLGPEADEAMVVFSLDSLKDLIARERAHLQQEEQASLRETIEGSSNYFLTLWDRKSQAD